MVKFSNEPFGPRAFCFRRFVLIDEDAVSLVDIGLFRSSISFCVSLAHCVFQRFGLFHLGFQFVGIELVIVFLYYHFSVHGIYSDVPSFISNTSNLYLFSLFLSQPGQSLTVLLIFLKNQLFISLMFLFSISFLNVITFCSNFYYYCFVGFFAVHFGFNFLFFQFPKVKLR